MGLISDLIPENLSAERAKVLAAPENYSPQFFYRRTFSSKLLTLYGLPSTKNYQAVTDYLADYHPPMANNHDSLTLTQMEQILHDLCHQLSIPSIPLIQNPAQNSRFMIRPDGLGVRTPINITRADFDTMLDHEIQTHYLRALNNKKQPWAEQKRPRRFWKRTEEGLALYNSKGGERADLGSAAILYEAAFLAQKNGWQTVLTQLRQRGCSLERAFILALRVKRGLTDTSQPGGFTKDIVYWEGYWQVRDWLTNGGDIHDLYWGKIDTSQVEELRPQAVTQGLIYPTFLTVGGSGEIRTRDG